MKKIILFLVVAACSWCVRAQQFPSLAWNYGAGSSTLDHVLAVAVDDSGYVYATGKTTGSVDYDPGPGVSTGMGGQGFFLVKMDNLGNFLWVKTLNAGTGSSGTALCVDDSNHVVVAGEFAGTADFDFGPGVYNLTAATPQDVFVLKVDGNGGFRWARQLAGPGDEEATDIATARDGSIAVCGTFKYTVDFDPGPGVFNLASAGGNDGYLLRLDRNGDFVWAGRFGSSGAWDAAPALAFDDAGNLHGTAETYGGVDMDMGPGVNNLPASSTMVGVVYKLDPQMNVIWVKSLLGTTNSVYVQGLAVDPWGGVGVGGDHSGTLDLDPGPGSYPVVSGNFTTVDYFLKLDANGNFRWGFNLYGIGGYGSVKDVACDAMGAFYWMGYFSAGHDFDPTPAVYYMNTTTADHNIYMTKHDSGGVHQWSAWVGGTSGANEGHSLVVDGYRHIYWGGEMQYPADMDPGPGAVTVSGNLQGDICLSKWEQCPTVTGMVSRVDCDSALVNGQYYTQSGVYTQHLVSVNGCDSVLTVEVTIAGTDTSLSATACESYALNSQVYTSSGTYTQVLTNVAGCDSVITLNLVILAGSVHVVNAAACGSYSLNGQVYSVSGTYTQVLTNAVGCDSVITLNLEVAEVVAGISASGNMLTAGPLSGGVSYQWLDCGNGMAVVPGATGQVYVVGPGSGAFAVVVDSAGCVDTSGCVTVVRFEGKRVENVRVWPNPHEGQFWVDVRALQLDGALELMVVDAMGRVVWREGLDEDGVTFVDLRPVSAGIYRGMVQDMDGGFRVGFLIQVKQEGLR